MLPILIIIDGVIIFGIFPLPLPFLRCARTGELEALMVAALLLVVIPTLGLPLLVTLGEVPELVTFLTSLELSVFDPGANNPGLLGFLAIVLREEFSDAKWFFSVFFTSEVAALFPLTLIGVFGIPSLAKLFIMYRIGF